MFHRHLRALTFLLVAAQVFLSAPVVAAMTNDSGTASTTSMPCADLMPPAADGEACPCCPDGVENAAGCLSACMASLGAIPTLVLPTTSTKSAEATASFAVPLVHPADPPLKPPPIR